MRKAVLKELEAVIAEASSAAEMIVREGPVAAMQKLNRKPETPEGSGQ